LVVVRYSRVGLGVITGRKILPTNRP
jgi:hypothetical protein